jgi:hypothetical protein
MDAQFLGSLTVFLQIIDEEGFIGIDIRQPDYLLIDVGIRLSQMHSLREETVLEIILYPMVLIREEMLLFDKKVLTLHSCLRNNK